MPEKKSLLIHYNPYRLPERAPSYLVFTEVPNSTHYDPIITALIRVMSKSAGAFPDREDKLDAIAFWQAFIKFYKFKTKLSKEELETSGYESEEDYELSRRNLAKHLMVKLGLIKTTKEFIADETGTNFIKEEIGTLEAFKQVSEIHEMSGFDKVIIIDTMCCEEISLWGLNRRLLR